MLNKICGIIAEYNPFHNGHAFHIAKTREALKPCFAAVVMSGDFVQRGESALCDKWARARMALLNGADLVIELPAYFALSGASSFASAAVKLLSAIGAEYVSFGAETDDLPLLRRAALVQEDKTALRETLKTGKPYAAALAASFGNTGLLDTPNNLLAIEYLRAIERLKLENPERVITPFALKRETPHDSKETSGNAASASKIREMIRSGSDISGFIPQNCESVLAEALERAPRRDSPYFAAALRHTAVSLGVKAFQVAAGANEGLGERLYKAALAHGDIPGIISEAKTRRFSESRVRRTACATIISLTNKNFNIFSQNNYPGYIRVLGLKKNAAPLVSAIAANAPVPVILNLKKDYEKISQTPQSNLLEADIRAAHIFGAAAAAPVISEFSRPLVII